MTRSYTYSALALRVKPTGESNREAWFLTSEEGLIRATVFGGPKSRLRSQVAPFHEGKLWIYHDPVRDSRKVSDFDVQSWRPGIRELYERTMAADALAETILASQGGGGAWPRAAELAGSVLDALEAADPAACSRMGIYFLWHWAAILGAKPDLSACGGECQAPERGNARNNACEARQDGVLWYSARKEALFCEKCAQAQRTDRQPPLMRLGPGARRWLSEIESLPAAALARISLDTPSLEQARALSQAVLAGALGRKLPTWEGI